MGRFRSMLKRAKKRLTNALLCGCSFQDLPPKSPGSVRSSSSSSVSSSSLSPVGYTSNSSVSSLSPVVSTSNSSVSSLSPVVSTSYTINNATLEVNKRFANARKAAIQSGCYSYESEYSQPTQDFSNDNPERPKSAQSVSSKSLSCEKVSSGDLGPSVSQISLKSISQAETEELGDVPSPQSNLKSVSSNNSGCASKTPSPATQNTESANQNSTLSESDKTIQACASENDHPTCPTISDPTLQKLDSAEKTGIGIEARPETAEQPQKEALKSAESSPRSPREGIPEKVVFGNFNQCELPDPFAGAQCTSIALTALAYHQEVSPIKKWKSGDLDKILQWGTANHHAYRTIMHFSDNPDGRIALSDLPSRSEVRVERKNCLFSTNEMVFGPLKYGADVTEETEGIPSLGKGLRAVSYLSKNLLITIGNFSHAIIVHKESYYLIDSHGHFQIPGIKKNKNSVCLKFNSQKELVAFLIRQYHDVYYEIMPIQISKSC